MSKMEQYLKPSATIDSDNDLITRKAAELTKDKHTAEEKARDLFYWVRDNIKYVPFIPLEVLKDYRASKTIQRGEGFCVEKATVLAAFARAVGIPARLHFADIRNHRGPDNMTEFLGTNLFPYHSFDELYIDQQWVKVAPTFELKVCRENRLFPVEFDGRQDSLLPSQDLDGNQHIEYLQDHGCYEDVSLDEIYEAWATAYSMGSRRQLRHMIQAQEVQRTIGHSNKN